MKIALTAIRIAIPMSANNCSAGKLNFTPTTILTKAPIPAPTPASKTKGKRCDFDSLDR